MAGPRDGDQGYTPEGDMSRLDKEGLVKRVLGVLLVVGAAVCLTVSASARTDHTAVSVNKTGAGTVTSNPRGSQCNNPPGSNLCINGITCGNDCSDSFKQGTSVTFTATPDSGATFLGWGGACSGTSTTCSLTMPASDTSLSIDASFSGSGGGGGPPPPPPPSRYALEVVKSGTGAGSVVSDPAGIDCGPTCSMTSDNGQQITLKPTAAPGSVFKGFSGACSGATCIFTLTADSVVTAVFDTAAPVEYPLSVTKAGDGSGTVTSSTGGIACGPTCSVTLPAGTAVALSAVADDGATFTGWSGGACSGTFACTLTLSAPVAVTATFMKVRDTTAPRVVAFAATVKRGKRSRLTYFVSDDSGRSSEKIVVYKGRKVLARLAAAEHVATAGTVRAVTWKVPAKLALGKRRFCVTAADASGNASAPSCAPVTIKR